jgi:hypothetical protein
LCRTDTPFGFAQGKLCPSLLTLFLDSGKKNGAEPFAACAIRFSSLYPEYQIRRGHVTWFRTIYSPLNQSLASKTSPLPP